MSELARYLAGDNYLTRSASGLKRGLSALADSLVAGSNKGIENMQAALSGVRVKPGAILTDAGYVMPDASGQPDFTQVGLEREPDVLRALELFGNIMGPVKGATVAAKSGSVGKVAADVAQRAHRMPTRDEVRIQGGALSSRIQENEIAKILDDHGISYEYHPNGGVSAEEVYVSPGGKVETRKKYFDTTSTIGTIRNWLGY